MLEESSPAPVGFPSAGPSDRLIGCFSNKFRSTSSLHVIGKEHRVHAITRTSALFISLVAITLLGSAAWAEPVTGSGVSKTEQRDVGEFQKIHVNGSSNVNIVIGDKQSVSVTTDDNL